MKILITGGVGFVGVNLAINLKKKGNKIFCIDNFFKNIGASHNLNLLKANKINFDYCDIRNQNDIFDYFIQNKGFDFVIHMASQVAFSKSIKYPRLDFEINAVGTFNLLEAIRIYSKKSLFLYASTNQVYGNLNKEKFIERKSRFEFKNLTDGVDENYKLDYLSPYGCSKGVGEIYSIDYARVYDIKSFIFRFGGIYGHNQFSYEDHGWISYITNMIRLNKKFNRYGHGKQVRDVLYIDDICNAVDLLINKADTVKKGEIFNIGGGKHNTLSVLELMKLVQNLTGNKEKSIINDMRKADKLVMYLNIQKAKKILNWEPNVDPVSGIKKLLKWQENLN